MEESRRHACSMFIRTSKSLSIQLILELNFQSLHQNMSENTHIHNPIEKKKSYSIELQKSCRSEEVHYRGSLHELD